MWRKFLQILSYIFTICFNDNYYKLGKIIAYLMLRLQSCKLRNNKYMIASTQATTIEIFAFIAVVVFKLLSRKVLFANRKYNRKW